MRTLFLFFIVTFQTFNCFSQWSEVKPHPNITDFRSIFFTNDSTGFIGCTTYDTISSLVYHNNRILKTTNWGVTWNTVYQASIDTISPGYTNLLAIYFTTPLKGYVTGSNYKMLRTFDGGNTWHFQAIPAGVSQVSTLLFTDSLIGYACDQWELHKTFDGGDTWELDTNLSGGSFDLSFPSKDVGFSSFYKTNNGAQSWETFSHPPLSENAIEFLNDSIGFMAGMGQGGSPVYNYGIVAKTINSAQTWIFNTFNQELGSFQDLKFVNSTEGYLVGGGNSNNKPLWKSIDGGQTWYQQQVNYTGNFGSPRYIYCPSGNVCYVTSSRNKVYRTTNGGGPLIGLGIGEKENKSLIIYPNPAIEYINFLNLESNSTISVTDMAGQLIIKTYLSSSEKLDITNLSRGIYFIRVQSSKNEQTLKLLKQ